MKAVPRIVIKLSAIVLLVAAGLEGPQLLAEMAGNAVDRASLLREAMGYILKPKCDLNVAIDKIKAVVDCDPSHPENDRILLTIADLFVNGDSYGGTAYPGTAIEVYKAIIEKYPLNGRSVVLAHIGIGDVYFGTGRGELARKYYEHVVRVDTNEPEWEALRGWVERQKVALGPVIAGTALVPRSDPASLVNLSRLREEFEDVPSVREAIDAKYAEVQRKVVDELDTIMSGDPADGFAVDFQDFPPEQPEMAPRSSDSELGVIPSDRGYSGAPNQPSFVAEQRTASSSGPFSKGKGLSVFLIALGTIVTVSGGLCWWVGQSKLASSAKVPFGKKGGDIVSDNEQM